MECHICSQKMIPVFQTKVLNKHIVNYFQCDNCKFIQTENPYWLKEAYENVITSLDIGLVSRNLYLREQIPPIIDHLFPGSKVMVDYGGGYGLFVRMMRDLGYDFYRQDIYCDNLFSKHFDISDRENKHFDILTAFEVFEHLPDPVKEVEKMCSFADNIIFSTEISPVNVKDFGKWWYVAPETGQHIAFYSKESLHLLAKKFKKFYYTNGRNLHVFSSVELDQKIVDKVLPVHKELSLTDRVKRRLFPSGTTKNSLLQSDYEMILQLLNNKGK